MFKIKKSRGCCAIYELYDLHTMNNPRGETPYVEPRGATKEQWDKAISGVLAKAKKSGNGYLPSVIVFSDATFSQQLDPLAGHAWYKALRSRKYDVDRTSLGRNPKSGNYVTMYCWYLEEGV